MVSVHKFGLPTLFIFFLIGDGLADEGKSTKIRLAIEKSLPVLQEGARTFRERSEGGCISCHHQGLILQTVALARQSGYSIEEGLATQERERVHGFYARRHTLYQQALSDSHAAQRADTYGNFTVHVGYWLWGLASERVAGDESLATATRLLSTKQRQDGSWTFEDSARAPMQASDFATTALAILALKNYGSPADAKTLDECVVLGAKWLTTSLPRTTDESAFQLLGLFWSGTLPEKNHLTSERLFAEQRSDGGWGQQANMLSDPYATGLVVVALRHAAGIESSHAAIQRAVDYLLSTQRADGTWFVKTRAIPSNPYFESGFPYGKSQFISYAASCWATQALLLGDNNYLSAEPASLK